MAVYGYCRVSTGRQVSEGESLDVQQRRIQGYADMQGWAVEHIFVEEGVSGSKPVHERPEGKQLLGVLNIGDILVVAKLDRLFRSALDALQVTEDLRKRGVHVHLLDLGGDIANNGMSKLFLTISAAFAEAERDRIRERVSEMKSDQRKRGRYLGGKVPFGFTVGDDGELVEDAAQQAALVKMRAMRASGATLRGIADAMVQDGFQISHAGVKKLLA